MKASPTIPGVRRATADALKLSEGGSLPRILVIVGAALSCTLLAMEYFEPYPYYGPKKLTAVAMCITVMLGGALWDVTSGRRDAVEAWKFWGVAGKVALLVCAFRVYELENRAFFEFIALLTLFGFIVNHHLPGNYRRPFFLLLSAIGITVIFGTVSAIAALALVIIGLALIGVCHLPIPMWARVAILVACALGLATIRIRWLYVGSAAVALPILASMFMFRLPVYLYDISNNKGPTDAAGRLSYFFMFPNLVFPFFPVVDFATFGRTYYNDSAVSIYHRGAIFMLRGLTHLLCYRVVDLYFALAPDAVQGPGTFLQFILANFGLYLRISGMFHLIVGLLLLFGFNLPETHSRFYFSTSFIDFWRRINIYWKDFMQKMVFNPCFVQFKKLGISHSMSVALSIVVVFVATWVLHAYQWFWLTGTMLFTLPDILFWAILGVLLVGQTLYEMRSNKPTRSITSRHAVWVEPLAHVVRVTCTMLTICLLWSFWTSSTVADWLALLARSGLVPALSAGGSATAAQWLQTSIVALFVLGAFGVTAGLALSFAGSPSLARRQRKPLFSFRASVGLGAALVCGLLAIQLRPLALSLPTSVQEFAQSIGESKLNRNEFADRGYYEGLTTGGRFNPELWEFYMTRPQEILVGRAGNDYLGREYTPNSTITVGNRTFRINRWAMYDRDYELEKPADTYRIAVIGDSRSVGWGVAYDERFETLLEQELNNKLPKGKFRRLEILNFSVHGYHPVERLIILEESALRFRPDTVIYVAGLLELAFEYHAQKIRLGVPMPYEFVELWNQRAGVDPTMSVVEIVRRLQPYRYELVSAVYERFMGRLREHGATGIWVNIPSISDRRADVEQTGRLARAAGLITMDLTGVYDPKVYRISERDGHPNAKGHRLIADYLETRLNDILDLKLPTPLQHQRP